MTEKKKFHSLKYRIFLVFCICVMLPLLLINIVISFRYERSLKESTTHAYDMLSTQIETNIDTYLRSIAKISLYPYYNNTIQKILYDNFVLEREDVRTRENNQIINDFLFHMIIQDSYLRSIFITNLDGEVVYEKSNGGYYRATDYFKSYIAEMKNDYEIIPTHFQSYVNRSRMEVFSYIRIIKEVNTNTPIGYAILEIDSSAISDMIERISNVSDEYVAIYLEDGSVISSNIPEEQLSLYKCSFEDWRTGPDKNREQIEIGGQNYLISFSNNSDNHLFTVIYQDESQVMSELNRLSLSTMLLTVFISAAVLLLAITASNRLTKPLIRLKNAMALVQKGDLSIQVEMPQGQDEVAELTKGFHAMLCSINDLIQREYKLSLQEKEAELKALQNQINPHFLYNTLESITMLAEINDDTEVADMVTSLGGFLRFAITTKDTVVTLEAELSCVDNYIGIQNIRYNDRIRLEIKCPDDLKNQKIVKMSIQPIVENILMHGYSGMKGEIYIGIHCSIEENYIRITVEDHGDGMSTETLAMVRENLEQEQELYPVKHSIGLRNVHQRLKLKYGLEYGLEFDSTTERGTVVTIKIPYEGGETVDA